jgi:hypothetical protein
MNAFGNPTRSYAIFNPKTAALLVVTLPCEQRHNPGNSQDRLSYHWHNMTVRQWGSDAKERLAKPYQEEWLFWQVALLIDHSSIGTHSNFACLQLEAYFNDYFAPDAILFAA